MGWGITRSCSHHHKLQNTAGYVKYNLLISATFVRSSWETIAVSSTSYWLQQLVCRFSSVISSIISALWIEWCQKEKNGCLDFTRGLCFLSRALWKRYGMLLERNKGSRKNVTCKKKTGIRYYSSYDSVIISLTTQPIERCKARRPGSSEVPRNPLTSWDVSSIPANGIFLTKKNKLK